MPSILPSHSLPSLIRRIHDNALREEFSCYLQKAFHTLHPSQAFVPSWHLDAISEYLGALERHDIHRLIINMPPRSMKSMTVSVAWTSYILGRRPSEKIITASYAAPLSLKHAMDTRVLIRNPWYRQAFPRMRVLAGQDEKHKFVTTEQGFRLATSVGGTLTGEGADILIIDDPLNPAQAASPRMRARANHWFDHTLSSRLNDKHSGSILLVMQRLHEEDMTGHLLAKGGWEHVCLPAMASSPITISIGKFHKIMAEGELLQPARESLPVLEQLKRDLGSHGFAAQYLQSPIPADGEMIKRDWLHVAEPPHACERVIQSWDTAIKAGEANDRSACVTIGASGGSYHILDVTVVKQEYTALKRTIEEMAQRHRPQAVLIEDKASGQSLLQDLRLSTSLPVIPILPRGDKIHRAARITPLMEAGRVIFASHSAWMPALEAELLAFPHARHDDQVDALTQGLLWLEERNYNESYVRVI